MNFKLNDVMEGETMMLGTALGGATREGLVTRILRGQGFEVDDGVHQQTILVRDCRILEGAEAEGIKAMLAAAVGGRLRRTDSTLKPGQPLYGVVDHAWWEEELRVRSSAASATALPAELARQVPDCRPDGTAEEQGAEPDFAVFAEGSVVADMAVVLTQERQGWGECAAERAWQRQMARLRGTDDSSPHSPLAPHRSPPLGEGGQNLPAALGGPPLRAVTPQPRRQSGCLASAFPSVAVLSEPPPAPTRPAPNPPTFERPPPLNLEGLLATAVEDDEHRLAAPRHVDGKAAETPTYSVSDESESESESEAGFDTTPPLPEEQDADDEDAEEQEQEEEDDCPAPDNTGLSIAFKGSVTFPVWFLAALGGFSIAYLWMVAAFVSRLTFRPT